MADSMIKPTGRGRRRGRTGGGRPRNEGQRYDSGKLRPPGPNPEVLARRALICDDPAMATTPLDAAYANGWLSKELYGAGKAYMAARAAAQMTPQFTGAPNRRVTANDNSIQTGAADELRKNWSSLSTNQVLAIRWNELTGKEIVAIWDSAMRDVGRHVEPSKAAEFSGRALARWKALAAAMTSLERMAVDAFCLYDEWPLWMADRIARREVTRGADRRQLLVSGLKAIQQALQPPRSPAKIDLVAPPSRPHSPPLVERTIYVDEDQNPVLEVERRRPRG